MPAPQSNQNTNCKSYLHEDYNPGEIRMRFHALVLIKGKNRGDRRGRKKRRKSWENKKKNTSQKPKKRRPEIGLNNLESRRKNKKPRTQTQKTMKRKNREKKGTEKVGKKNKTEAKEKKR
jgi:hypothetical protein